MMPTRSRIEQQIEYGLRLRKQCPAGPSESTSNEKVELILGDMSGERVRASTSGEGGEGGLSPAGSESDDSAVATLMRLRGSEPPSRSAQKANHKGKLARSLLTSRLHVDQRSPAARQVSAVLACIASQVQVWHAGANARHAAREPPQFPAPTAPPVGTNSLAKRARMRAA